MIKNEKDLIKRGIWWHKIYNLDRPHQGLGNLTPYEKLKSLGYPTGEEICLFPTLILDSVCCLDPFEIKRKSVQDHLNHDHPYKLEQVELLFFFLLIQYAHFPIDSVIATFYIHPLFSHSHNCFIDFRRN